MSGLAIRGPGTLKEILQAMEDSCCSVDCDRKAEFLIVTVCNCLDEKRRTLTPDVEMSTWCARCLSEAFEALREGVEQRNAPVEDREGVDEGELARDLSFTVLALDSIETSLPVLMASLRGMTPGRRRVRPQKAASSDV
jgi:hypothetical protein